MGLPQIYINFWKKAVSAIKRSQRGITCVIIFDDKQSKESPTYERVKFEADLSTDKYTDENLKILKRCFYTNVNELIVVSVPSKKKTFADIKPTLDKLKFDYGCIVSDTLQTDFVSYIKSRNQVLRGKRAKAVVNDVTVADDMRVIRVKNKNVTDKDTGKVIPMHEYLPRIASVLSNMPMNQSCTFYTFEDLADTDMSFVQPEKTIDQTIDDGYLVLIHDTDSRNNNIIRIARGVNSLHSLDSRVSKEFKKIIIVESIDLITEDIYTVFKEEYIRHFKNSLDNQMLFITSINQYFRQLANEEILDPNFDNRANVDVEAQRGAWLAEGKAEAQDWNDEKVRAMTYGSTVYLAGKVKILDAIEDLQFDINMQ